MGGGGGIRLESYIPGCIAVNGGYLKDGRIRLPCVSCKTLSQHVLTPQKMRNFVVRLGHSSVERVYYILSINNMRTRGNARGSSFRLKRTIF